MRLTCLFSFLFLIGCSSSKLARRGEAAKAAEKTSAKREQRPAKKKSLLDKSEMEKMLLSQKLFKVGDSFYETTCSLSKSGAIAHILPVEKDQKKEFKASFRFEYYDAQEKPAGGNQVVASVRSESLNTLVADKSPPRKAARCSLTFASLKN